MSQATLGYRPTPGLGARGWARRGRGARGVRGWKCLRVETRVFWPRLVSHPRGRGAEGPVGLASSCRDCQYNGSDLYVDQAPGGARLGAASRLRLMNALDGCTPVDGDAGSCRAQRCPCGRGQWRGGSGGDPPPTSHTRKSSALLGGVWTGQIDGGARHAPNVSRPGHGPSARTQPVSWIQPSSSPPSSAA